MRKVAIIPARKGSKRVRGKNTRPLFGIPLFERTVTNLLNSNAFDEIYVSTNDEKVHEISEKYGIRHDFNREERLCDDYTTTKSVIEDAIFKYKLNETSDLACVVYPTSIFFDTEIIGLSIQSAIDLKPYEVLQSVVEYSHPIQRSFSINSDGYLIYNFPEFMNSRTQDISKSFFDAGQFYWASVKTWIASLDTWSRIPFLIQDSDCQDLDSEKDWEITEMKFKLKYGIDLTQN